MDQSLIIPAGVSMPNSADLVRKYRYDKSPLTIGLIVARKWADFKISNSPISWIDIENEIKE